MQEWFSQHKRQVQSLSAAMLVFCLAVGLGLVAILILNHGKLTYTLDDAYIHLALAENIASGHYGVNLGEVSAASSSILWPFLLAPFAASSLGEWIPLVINFLSGLATLVVYGQINFLAFEEIEMPGKDLFLAGILIVMIPMANLVALVFTGMEHSLQVFLAGAAILGLIVETRTDQVRAWLPVVLVLGPLIRYENLAISVPALLYLALRNHIRFCLLTGMVMAATLGVYSTFLHSNGLSWIPTSIIAKSGFGLMPDLPQALIINLYQNRLAAQGGLLSLWILLLSGIVLLGRNKAERLLAGCIALGVAAHLLFGTAGSHRRYEAYIWATAILTLTYFYRHIIARLVARARPWQIAVFLGGVTLVTVPLSLLAFALVPIGANNVYGQQYQMHRFLTEYYRAPVAVNDLGYVSYRNDSYVLDLWGLASTDALQARLTRDDRLWMDELTRKQNVELAMIYDHWLGTDVPANWVSVGQMWTKGLRVGMAASRVHFYATNAAAAERTKSLLAEFRRTLPSITHFDFEGETAP